MVAHTGQDPLQPFHDLIGKVPADVGLADLGVLRFDLFPGLVLLVDKMVQVVHRDEIVGDICADKVGFRQDDAALEVHHLVCLGEIQDLPGQHHTRRLAPNLAATDAPAADSL